MAITTTYKPVDEKARILEVLEAVLYIKGRIYLDTQRNKFFKFLDKHSKTLDTIADTKIKKFDMRQYAMFRDITEMPTYDYKTIRRVLSEDREFGEDPRCQQSY